MAAILLFAFISGVITILSPCIIPVLPIVLSGGISSGKARPFGVIAGFTLSFTFFTLALSAIVQAIGIQADAMRYVAIALIVILGLVMLIPRLSGGFEVLASRIVARSFGTAKPASSRYNGFWGGLPVGLSLGLVWTPCVGPIMASVISLALTRRVDGGAIFITLAYSIGTAIPMLGVMLGGRALLSRVPSLKKRMASIQRIFGAVMILMGLVLAFQWDRSLQAAILKAFPSYGSGLTALENIGPVRAALESRSARMGNPRGGVGAAAGSQVFSGAPADVMEATLGDYGAAPDFVAGGPWFNTGSAEGGLAPQSPPLDLASLRGKVVLVDFWTYSCVNCIRTIPELRALYEAYGKKGFVVVGVHSPEFAFEKVPANVERAMRELGVTWPVVLDNDFTEWQAYGNNYWPAHYFIDAKGRVRYWRFGEGGYREAETVIRQLLAEAGSDAASLAPAPLPGASLADNTPETYLGYGRASGFVSAVAPIADKSVDFRPARTPANAEWNLMGTWTVAQEYVESAGGGRLELGFNAKDVYLVIEPVEAGVTVSVSVDGKPAADGPDVAGGVVTPTGSRLYHLVSLPRAGFHVLRLEVKGRVRLFAFTFG